MKPALPLIAVPPRSSEELALIAAIADDLAMAVWVARAPDGTFVYANRAFDEIMGTGPREEARAGRFTQPYGIYTRDGKPYPEAQLPFPRALETRSNVVIDDIAIHRPDGRRVCVRAVGRPMFDASGTVTHVSIVFTDVTEEVQAAARELEAESRAAFLEARLRQVISHAPIILFAYDRDGVMTLSEGRGLQNLKWSPSDFLGRSVFDLYRDTPSILSNTRRALNGETFTTIDRLGPVVLETTVTPMRDGKGEVAGVIGVSTDISDRVEMQARLVQAERLSSMGTLAASVAHEINNPLTYVLGNLEVLATQLTSLEGPMKPGALADILALVTDAREGADRVRRIVRGLKAFSRPHDGTSGPTDVCVVLDRSLAIADNEIRHRARLVKTYEPVPMVDADDVRLSQVFVNLLVNAAQSIPEGQADAHEIRVRTSLEGEHVVITVEDTGGGIAEEARAHIFEPFFTTKPVGVGTGLGLSVCYGIVKALGGTIEVATELGRGSTFRVRLPAMPRRSATAAVARMWDAPTARGRLLIIDDDIRVAKALCLLLETDHDVDVSSHPKQALERLLSGARYDLIFCDLMMPEMTGMDLHAALLKKVPDQAERMVFVTGGAFTIAASDFLDAVGNARLEKPFNIAHLSAVLRERLGLKAV